MADTTRSESKPRNGQRARRPKADNGAAPAADREAAPFGHGILDEPAAEVPPAPAQETIAEAQPKPAPAPEPSPAVAEAAPPPAEAPATPPHRRGTEDQEGPRGFDAETNN